MAREEMALARLPDSVVEYIFSLTPRTRSHEKLGRDALPLVCRGFNRIYRSSKLLWGNIVLYMDRDVPEEEVAGLLPSLRHKGSAATYLYARMRSNKVALPDLMAHFSPDRLSALALDLGAGTYADQRAGQLSCLGRFSRLKSLEVLCVSTYPLQDDLSWLAVATGLQGLSLRLNLVGTDACARIARLTALSMLRLCYFPADAQLTSTLACLSRLQTLDLVVLGADAQQEQQLGAACFRYLQQLSRLDICHMPKGSGNAGEAASVRLQLGGLSTMPRLQQLTLQCCIDLDQQDLLRCRELRHLRLHAMAPEPFAASEGGGAPALTSLEWQPDLRPFQGVDAGVASIAFPEGLCQLTQLQQLCAKIMDDEINVQIHVSLPAALSQLRELRRLELSCLGLLELPAAITGLSKLECLDLRKNFLSSETFPTGPNLANLRCLDLHGNYMRQIPEALAGAAKLETLDCSENLYFQFSTDHLALLPGLRRLYITKRLLYCSPQLEEFQSPLAMLEVLWTTDTVRHTLQVHRRFPNVEVIVDGYLCNEVWWLREWCSS